VGDRVRHPERGRGRVVHARTDRSYKLGKWLCVRWLVVEYSDGTRRSERQQDLNYEGGPSP
jgi:hypothetical protein